MLLTISTCGVDVGAAAIVRGLDGSKICQGLPGMCGVPVSKAVLPGTHNSPAYDMPPDGKDLLKIQPLDNVATRAATGTLGAVRGV